MTCANVLVLVIFFGNFANENASRAPYRNHFFCFVVVTSKISLHVFVISCSSSSAMRLPAIESSSVIAFRNFNEEVKRPGVWESEQGVASTPEKSRDNLASLYRPPFHLMFQGSFEKVSII